MPTALQNQLQSFKDQNKASSALRSDSKTPNLSGLQVDSDELRHLASEQFETICNGNRALKNYASLFSSKYKTFDRLMMGEKESLALDNTLREFLVHLSPFFMDNSCLAIYDWLITRFYIHKFNCVPLILSLINFFDSNSFKLLLREVLSFNDSKKFDSLRKIANSLIEFNHNIFCDLFTFQNDFLNEYLDICKIFLSVDFHLLNDDLQKKVEKRLTLDVLLISNMLNKQKLTKNALKLVCDYCSYVCESEIWILKSLPLFIVLNYKYEMPLKLKHNIMVNIGQSTLDCNTKIEVFDSFIGFSDLIEESAILAILNAVDGSTASCAINLLRKILLMIADNAEKVHMSKKLSAGLKRTINSVMISNTDTHLLEKLYHDLFRLYCLAISNQNLHQSLRKICLYLLSTNSDLFLHSLNIFMKLNNPISEYNNMFVDFLDVKDTNTKSINLEIKQYLNHSKRWKNLDYNLKLIYIVELAKMSNIIECQEIIDSLFTNSKNKTMLKEFLTILMNDMLLNSEYKDIAKEFILKNSYILNKILIKNDKSESQSRNLCMNYIDSIDNSVHDDVIVAIFPFLATIWETDKIYEFCNEYKKGCLKFTDINTYPISGKHHSILFFKNLVSDSISEDILDLIFIKSQTAAANDSNSLFEDDTLQKDFTMSIHSLLLLIDLVESKYIKNCYLSKLIHDAKTETILTDCQIDAFFETFIELEYKDILNLCKYDWYVSSIFKSLKKCKKNNDLIIQKLISLSLLFISKFSRSLNRVEEILNLFKRNLDIFINYSPIIGSIVDNKADIMLNPPKNINNIIDWIERSGNIDEASIENLVAILFMSKIHHRLNLKFENASYHLIEKFIVILLDKNVDSIPSDLLLHLRIKCSESFDKKLIRKLMSKFQDLSSDNKLTILLNSSYFMPKKYISQENLSKNLYGFEKFIKDFSDSQKYLINDFASRYNFASKSEDLKRLMEVYIASNCVNIELLYESCSILYKPATEFKSLSKLIKLLLNSEYHDASQKVYIVDLLEFFPSKKFTSFVKTNQSTFLNFLTKLSHNDFYRLCAIDKFFCKVFGSDTINELICSLFDNPLNEDSIKQLECIIKYIIMYKDDNKNEITKFLTMIFKISKSNAPVSQRLLRLFIIDYSSKLCEVFSVMLSDSDNNTCEYLLQFRIALKSIGTEELLNLNINSESIIGEVIDELQQIWRQNSLEDSLNIFCDFIQHNFAVLLNCEKVKVNKFAEMIQDCISFESRIYLITKLSISILEEDFSKPKVFIFFMTIINDFESETFSDKNEYFTSYLIEIVKQYLIKNSASFLSNTKLQNIFLRFMTRLWKSAIINLDDIISDLNIFDEFIVTCLEIFAENPDNQLISLLEFHNCLSDKLKEDFSHIIPQSCEVFMSIDFKTLINHETQYELFSKFIELNINDIPDTFRLYSLEIIISYVKLSSSVNIKSINKSISLIIENLEENSNYLKCFKLISDVEISSEDLLNFYSNTVSIIMKKISNCEQQEFSNCLCESIAHFGNCLSKNFDMPYSARTESMIKLLIKSVSVYVMNLDMEVFLVFYNNLHQLIEINKLLFYRLSLKILQNIKHLFKPCLVGIAVYLEEDITNLMEQNQKDLISCCNLSRRYIFMQQCSLLLESIDVVDQMDSDKVKKLLKSLILKIFDLRHLESLWLDHSEDFFKFLEHQLSDLLAAAMVLFTSDEEESDQTQLFFEKLNQLVERVDDNSNSSNHLFLFVIQNLCTRYNASIQLHAHHFATKLTALLNKKDNSLIKNLKTTLSRIEREIGEDGMRSLNFS